MPEQDERVEALERLIANNPDLERLEAVVADFNPFVAMGWTRQEARHSAFLRWLLDPDETHGLGTYPLRVFLKEILIGASGDDAPTVFDADMWDLDSTVVLAEWERIDILIRNDAEKFLVVLENKVGSSEHSQQLQRYRELIEVTFPEHGRIYVYLTPAGDTPSDEAYTPFSYAQVVACVDRIMHRRRGQLSDEVQKFLEQYTELVRRHIVEDSEIQELCRRLYEQHRLALDLIYEHRPDRALEVSRALQAAVEGTPGLTLDGSNKTYIRFTTETLDIFPPLAEGWTKSGRMVLFEFENANGRIALKLVLGPAPAHLRQIVHERAQERKDVLKRAHYKVYPKWWTFHGRPWLRPKPYAERTIEELSEQFAQMLNDFVDNELPELEAVLRPIAEEVREASDSLPQEG